MAVAIGAADEQGDCRIEPDGWACVANDAAPPAPAVRLQVTGVSLGVANGAYPLVA